MISIGYHIKQFNDSLHNIELHRLAYKIKTPEQKFIDYINQLRSVLMLDGQKYRQMKTNLPYVVAAKFHPSFRKIENFAKTSYFIIDLDHLADKEVDKEMLFGRLCNDPRTVLCFTSPSGDGLKVFFKLNEPFYDTSKYRIFYTLFAQQFALEFSVHQVIDKSTSDVARACFVSYDPDVYYNGNADAINADAFVDFDNQLQMQELISTQKETEKKVARSKDDVKCGQELPIDLFQQIKDRLNPTLKERREKKIFVPNELEGILPQITSRLSEFDISVDTIKNIHYGKQIKFKMLQWWGEINVFYGKRGFSIVKSTKSGSSEKLTNAAAEILSQFLFSEKE